MGCEIFMSRGSAIIASSARHVRWAGVAIAVGLARGDGSSMLMMIQSRRRFSIFSWKKKEILGAVNHSQTIWLQIWFAFLFGGHPGENFNFVVFNEL